ncbi:hypothetical protein RND71_025416 [Anisodus tanguticus]|uniref:CCHC-type domain-containing protein n=1 Tax=Anisodus tanguticus TaxID=243964 RepID=A0AAE1RRQ3_9SOLA|nr:hypothetical protein RND71_025416 [Anisodus tanguticus]
MARSESATLVQQVEKVSNEDVGEETSNLNETVTVREEDVTSKTKTLEEWEVGMNASDLLEEEFGNNVEIKNEPVRTPQLPVVKEEEMDGEELEQMLRERYRPGSSFVTYAEDNDERKRLFEQDTIVPTLKDPTIWKVKCTVGREKHSAFCLMQKYVDLLALGTKLQIISAFALDHVKGFIYIEADRQFDVYEACKCICSIYSSRVVPVPMNEVSHLIAVRNKSSGISEGMWARVKSGIYKGDLAQVVAVNDARKKVTVKLIPRIDLQAIADKFGGGVTAKKGVIPAPRLISATELEDFRPLIQCRKDRDTNLMFEILDGKILKDGYLYKKVGTDSLSYWGVAPTEAELLKFEPSSNDEPRDVEWLTQLYGDRRKKRITNDLKVGEKGGEKGESSSSSGMENNFEVDDLVFFGRNDFGIIIGKEKDDSFKIMKYGSERPVVVSTQLRELKRASFDKKLFTVKDQLANAISISDVVRVLDGSLKDRQGTVKQIYKGVVFLYEQSEQDNNGYLCVKGQMCERITGSGGVLNEKGSEPGSGFADLSSSPKSPLSPEKSWRVRDDNSSFKREDKNEMFSVGQSLRIRVGPLKGYLCRVLAIRRSDVTVKLDSQQKILTVKSEHLAEVQVKSSVMSLGGDGDTSKPFDLLGTQDGSQDWTVQGATVTDGNTGNAGASSSAERQNLCAGVLGLPFLLQAYRSIQLDSADEPKTGMIIVPYCECYQLGKCCLSPCLLAFLGLITRSDSIWETKATQTQNSSWGASGVSDRTVAGSGQDDGWAKATSTAGATSGASDGWDKKVESHQESTEKVMDNSWGRSVQKQGNNDDSDKTSWGKQDGGSSWGKQSDANAETDWKKQDGGSDKTDSKTSWSKQDARSSWNKSDGGSSWGKQSDANAETGWKKQDGGSNKTDSKISWSQQDAGSSWKKSEGEGGSSWGKQSDAKTDNNWKKPDSGSSWSKPDNKTSSSQQGSGSSWNKNNGGSSWGKQSDANAETDGKKQDGGSSWSKADDSKLDDGSSWNKNDDGSFAKQAGGTSWDKGSGGSAWNTKEDGSGGGEDSKSTWGKQDGGSSWGKQAAGGSSWGRPVDHTTEESKRSDQSESWKKPSGAFVGWKEGEQDSSAWNSKSAAEHDVNGKNQNDPWSSKKTSDGGSSTGWGQSNSWKSGTNDAVGTQDSWSSKSNWNSGSGFGGNNQQSDSYSDRGRGGGWRGGRGGSDRGGYGGGDGSDRGGFGGRGGFRGRGDRGGRSSGGGGGGCYKCGEDGHFARECPSGGGGGRSSGGGGGGGCYKCGEDGHIARECPSSGGGGRSSGGGSCYKCGEDGHFARECPSGGGGRSSGGGGGGGCYKCGEDGHFARECPSGGGGGRSSGGGGGGSCYKCGEEGHFARECPSGGGGGGGTCYKCGEEGHFSRECTKGTGSGNASTAWTGSGNVSTAWTGSGNASTAWTGSGNASTAWTANKSNTEDVNKSKETSDGPGDAWGKATSSWGKGNSSGSQGTGSGNASTAWTANKSNTEDVNKSKETSDGPGDAWGKATSSWGKGNSSSSQGGW